MKKLLLSMMLVACLLIGCALAEGIPFYEVSPVWYEEGNFCIEVPNAWYVSQQDGSSAPVCMVVTDKNEVILLARLAGGMNLSEDPMGMAPFLEEGKRLFATGKSTPQSRVTEVFTVDTLPALRVSMVGQGYEMVWVKDAGDLYFMMYEDSFRESAAVVENSFHLLQYNTEPITREEDYTFEPDGKGGAVVTGYTGEAVRIRVPDTLGGLPVVALGEKAFYEQQDIRWVELPDTVSRIGACCFSGATKLWHIALPDAVTVIPAGMFESCFRLAEVQMPDTVTEIGEGAFWANSYLEYLRLPASLTSIGASNFVACPYLEGFEGGDVCAGFTTAEDGAVLLSRDGKRLVCCAAWLEKETYVVPAGVETIDMMAFDDAQFLKRVVLPESCQEIGMGAFARAMQLKSLTIPAGVSRIGIMPGMDGMGFIASTAVTIIGEEGSAAQKYAEQFELPFESLEQGSEK